MAPGYKIEIDRARSLLCFSFWGLLDERIAATWGAERDAAVRQLGMAPNSHRALYDLSRLSLPTNDVSQLLASFVGDGRSMSGRAAVVTGSAIQRLQVRRVSGHPNVAFFTDRAEAGRWLFASDSEACAA